MEILEQGSSRRPPSRWTMVAAALAVALGGAAFVHDREDAPQETRVPAAESPSTSPGSSDPSTGPVGEPDAALPDDWQPYIVRLLARAEREEHWTGSALPTSDGSLRLYLKHRPSPRLRQLAAQAPTGLRVVFRRARYSLDELQAARDALIGRDPRIASVVIPASGSTLLVGLTPAAFPAGLSPTDRGQITRAINSKVPLILFVDSEPTNVS